jgi:hypothetical protein
VGRGFHCLSKSFDEINFLTKKKKSSDRTNRESKKSHVHDHSVGLCVKIVKKKEKRIFFHSGNDMISSLRPVQGKKIIWKKQFVRETPRLCCLLTFLLDRKRPSVCYIPPRDWSRKEEKKWDPMFAVSISWLTKRLFAARAELSWDFDLQFDCSNQFSHSPDYLTSDCTSSCLPACLRYCLISLYFASACLSTYMSCDDLQRNLFQNILQSNIWMHKIFSK